LSRVKTDRVRPVPLPAETVVVQVDDLSHDGRGIAHRDGKAVFIDGALPGETVRLHYTARHSQYDEGRVEALLTPSPERVEPRCAHFGVCGGCSLQHLAADRQLAYKQQWLLDNLARIGKVQPGQILEPLHGPTWGYRYKARLGVRQVLKKGRVLVGFRERHRAYLADLKRCEVLQPRIGALLDELGQLVGRLSIHNRLPQIEVAVGDDAAALSLRVLAPPSAEDRALLSDFGRRHHLHIYLQPKGPATTYPLWPEGATPLSYRLPGYDLELAFMPCHFIQINPAINRQMVEQAVTLLDVQADEQVLDLFCGLGNFTLALARRAHQVVGVEGDAGLVEWAGRNAARNGVANVNFYEADLTQDLGAQPWLQMPYNKLLLDPPRSGALEILPHIAALQVRRVVYISCHPATLARDAGELVQRFGYRLVSAGVMDMFPHTAHVESIALFEHA
jgi:23S rRNA (uracil1939-C5)-methyltransferase